MAEPFNPTLSRGLRDLRDQMPTMPTTSNFDPTKQVLVFVGGYDTSMVRIIEILTSVFRYKRVDFVKGDTFRNQRQFKFTLAADATIVIAIPRTIYAPIVSQARDQAVARKLPFFVSTGKWSNVKDLLEEHGLLVRTFTPAPEVLAPPPEIDLRGIKPSASLPPPAPPALPPAPPPEPLAVTKALEVQSATEPEDAEDAAAVADEMANNGRLTMEELIAHRVANLPLHVAQERAAFIVTTILDTPDINRDGLVKAVADKYNIRLGRRGLAAYLRTIGIHVEDGRKAIPFIRSQWAKKLIGDALVQVPSQRPVAPITVAAPVVTPTPPALAEAPAMAPTNPNDPMSDVKSALGLLKDALRNVQGLHGSINIRIDTRTATPVLEVKNDIQRVLVQQVGEL